MWPEPEPECHPVHRERLARAAAAGVMRTCREHGCPLCQLFAKFNYGCWCHGDAIDLYVFEGHDDTTRPYCVVCGDPDVCSACDRCATHQADWLSVGVVDTWVAYGDGPWLPHSMTAPRYEIRNPLLSSPCAREYWSSTIRRTTTYFAHDMIAVAS
jgi:hypothetical protein